MENDPVLPRRDIQGQRSTLPPSSPGVGVNVNVNVREGEELPFTGTGNENCLHGHGIITVDGKGKSRTQNDMEKIVAYECCSTFSYEGQGDEELTLEKGDIIKNVFEKRVGWWEGELGGKTGIFPSNSVIKVPFPPRRFKALFTYTPDHNEELLDFFAGAVIEYLEDVGEEGWCRGRSRRGRGRWEVGWFHPIFFMEPCAVLDLCVPALGFGGADADSESPLNNILLPQIPKKLMTYLPVKALKTARLVCQMWRKEGTKALEKRSRVSFSFNYKNENSSRVSRYLQEMQNLKVRNLKLEINPSLRTAPPSEEVQETMMDNLRTLLNSFHTLTTLYLDADIRKDLYFLPVHLILTKLGGDLVELTLVGFLQFFPKMPVPLCPLPLMRNLKKFCDCSNALIGESDKAKWASLLVPLFSRSLEHFHCSSDLMNEAYLRAFLAQGNMPMPMLRGIEMGNQCSSNGVSTESLSLLLQINNPLSSLSLSCLLEEVEVCRLLEELYSKHSQTLEKLVICSNSENEDTDAEVGLNFPKFPELKEFSLTYYGELRRVTWKDGQELEEELDYNKHFPSLRNLKVLSGNSSESDPVFDVFFPVERRDLVVKTVEDLDAQLHLLGPRDPPLIGNTFRQRVKKIKLMFPNAFNKHFEG